MNCNIELLSSIVNQGVIYTEQVNDFCYENSMIYLSKFI